QRIDVGEMPVVGLPVLGRILAHRRDHDAVGQLQVAQLDRREKRAHADFREGGRGSRPICSERSAAPQPAGAATLPIPFDAVRRSRAEPACGYRVKLTAAAWTVAGTAGQLPAQSRGGVHDSAPGMPMTLRKLSLCCLVLLWPLAAGAAEISGVPRIRDAD